jgi:general secretion pathway protein D
LGEIPIAGINEPEIGQEIDEANIRMKDGEVSILGGLSDRERTRAYSGVPGFTNLPLLGYLFGTRTRHDIDQEVLIAIIPHIARAPDWGDQANQGVYAGTESIPKVQRGTQPVQVSLPPVTGAPPVLPKGTRGTALPPTAPSAPLPNPPTANVQFPAALPEPTVSSSQPRPQ